MILLNPVSSEYYRETKAQAILALGAYPKGLQVGGGIHAENAEEFLEAGASHVIVTSYVFRDGKINWENMEKLKHAVGKENVVIDLSCRKKEERLLYSDRPLAEVYGCKTDTGSFKGNCRILR